MRITTEIPGDLSRQIDRIIRDGWFADQEAVVREALQQFVDAKSFLGDSPRMLHRFAADFESPSHRGDVSPEGGQPFEGAVHGVHAGRVDQSPAASLVVEDHRHDLRPAAAPALAAAPDRPDLGR